MYLNITPLRELDQFPLAHSAAEGGQNAGRETWQAAIDQAEETPLLDTPEKLEAMRDFAQSSGGWTREEIDEWTPQEINALFLQWVAGDVRQCPAKLEGITFEEREGQWWHSSDSEPDMETGPFESRSDAYHDAMPDASRPPRAESLDEIDWEEYEIQASAGRISGNLSGSDDGEIEFYLGN